MMAKKKRRSREWTYGVAPEWTSETIVLAGFADGKRVSAYRLTPEQAREVAALLTSYADRMTARHSFPGGVVYVADPLSYCPEDLTAEEGPR